MASINEIHYLITTARAEHPVASSAIAEFIQTYKQAREDSDDAIRESAAFIARALQEHARGWLDDDDMIILLEGQRDLAGLRANNAQIALGSRIRSTVIRLIDIATALLVGAIIRTAATACVYLPTAHLPPVDKRHRPDNRVVNPAASRPDRPCSSALY